MTALWTATEAALATKGQALGDWHVDGVSIDTRTLKAGDLFVALQAARDGHDFVAQALAAGAGAALVSRIPEGLPKGAPLLLVDDVLKGLEALGRAARARTKAKVIAITGSVGKTSTKEMLREMLSAQGRVHVAEASYNNHWGVPLTLARMPVDTDLAVLEIGMNHPGEIAPLTRMVRPHVAMITTVAPAHMEAFGTIEGIAAEKAAIFEGLEAGGTAIVPNDLSVTPVLLQAAQAAQAQIVLFGAEVSQWQMLDSRVVGDVSVVTADTPVGQLVYKVASPGRHFAMNALGALASAMALGVDPAIAAADLGRWSPPKGRGQREAVALDPIDSQLYFDLVDDAFNANPASVAASLELFVQMQPRNGLGRIQKGRRIAILGDMLELGPKEIELHRALADLPAMAQIDLVHCVGPRIKALWQALPQDKRGNYVESVADLLPRAAHLVDAGDIVLVKGSKSIKVSMMVDALRKLDQGSASAEAEGM